MNGEYAAGGLECHHHLSHLKLLEECLVSVSPKKRQDAWKLGMSWLGAVERVDDTIESHHQGMLKNDDNLYVFFSSVGQSFTCDGRCRVPRRFLMRCCLRSPILPLQTSSHWNQNLWQTPGVFRGASTKVVRSGWFSEILFSMS
jgi:hypothetical protein